MELRDYVRLLRKRWLSIVVTAALGLVVAGVTTALVTPRYESSAQIFVSAQNPATTADLVQGNDFVQQRVSSYADIVTSAAVLAPVAEELGAGSTVAGLAQRVTAETPSSTVLINIAASASTAAGAADTANGVARSLIRVVGELETSAGTSAPSPVRLSVTDQATPPRTAQSPDVELNLTMGLLIGLALGVAVAILRDVLDSAVRSSHDVRRLGVPVLAEMPVDGGAREHPLVVRDDPASPRAETFRRLRTNLQFVTASTAARSVVVTSALDGEGKTTTAINLALTLASAGSRVALVDSDLRHPTLDRYLDLEGGRGLTTVLVGQTTLAEALQPFGETGKISVLTSGEIPPNPSELLSSNAMGDVVRELESDHDVVLLDAASLLAVTDSAVLSRMAGGVLLVVGSGATRRPQMGRALDALAAVDARVLGAALTRVPTKGLEEARDDSHFPGEREGVRRRSAVAAGPGPGS